MSEPDRPAPIRCHCGEILIPMNWALGPGWAHKQTRESLCRVFASPCESDSDRAEAELRAWADRIGVTTPMTMSTGVPRAVDRSWFANLPVSAEKQLLFYADGTVRFMHKCDRGERGVIVCAPALQLDSGVHTITPRNPTLGEVTVTPSILCPDCGVHGFVTDGRWRDA